MTHRYSTSTWAHPPRKANRHGYVYLIIAAASASSSVALFILIGA
jgi:hypothetical protein